MLRTRAESTCPEEQEPAKLRPLEHLLAQGPDMWTNSLRSLVLSPVVLMAIPAKEQGNCILIGLQSYIPDNRKSLASLCHTMFIEVSINIRLSSGVRLEAFIVQDPWNLYVKHVGHYTPSFFPHTKTCLSHSQPQPTHPKRWCPNPKAL